MKQALEGLLFLVGEDGLSISQISEILEIGLEESQKLMDELINDYETGERGLLIKKFGDEYKLTTKKEYANYYQKLAELSISKTLSQSALETLAIIAYNEPITRFQIDELRGVSSSQMIRNLMAKDLVKELGRSNSVGRPILYGITDQFLDYFGLASRDELPKIKNEENLENDEVDLYESKYKEEIEQL